MRVAIVDRYVTDTWYSSALYRALSEHCEVSYYGDKSAKGNVKPVWSTPWFPLQILREAIRDKINVVHLQFEINMFGSAYTNLLIPVLLFLIRLVRKKVVVTIHGVIPYKLFKSGKIKLILPKDAIKNIILMKYATFCLYGSLSKLSSKIIVHSQIFKRWLLEYLLNPEKIFIIPHGIDTNREVHPVKRWKNFGSRIVLNFGVITPRKGLETLIPAFAQLNSPNTVLLIVGREMPYYIGYKEKIEKLVKEYVVNDRVLFTGFLGDDEVHYLFEKAEIVVFPYSISISASGALSFAIQHCKPTIVTSTEFFSEELTQNEAIFVPIDDVEALRNVMKTLLESSSLREALSSKLELKAQRNTWEKVATLTLEIYYSHKKKDEMKYQDETAQMYNEFFSLAEGNYEYERAYGAVKPFLPSKVVLDVGCGTGQMGERVAKNCNFFVGMDFSKESIKICHAKIKNGNFIIADVEFLPFRRNEFDLVYCSFLLHHLKGAVSDVYQSTSEMFRVLKRGSEVIIAKEPNALNFGNSLLYWLVRTSRTLFFRKMPTSPHEKPISRWDLKNAFQGARITEYSIEEFGFLPVLLNLKTESSIGKLLFFFEDILERIPIIKKFGIAIKARGTKL